MATIHLGFAVGSGDAVAVPLRHLAVTGQTQESGKTTTLEGLVARSGVTALAFVTKRGESAFASGQRVQPYFRDRADWQFVTSIIDATLQEKNKFLRPWIMKICRTTRTLADVQLAVREALKSAKGIHEGVYTQLDAYLDLIVPEIQRTPLARSLELARGLNVMDLSAYATPMQMLFVQSAIDWVNEHERNMVVIVPEAWEFIPEGKGSPVKSSAVTLVRKGAGIGNFIWVDSQDMAGVDKTILRGCAVWIIGVQREANEIKRNLANIPASVKRPSAAAVAMLERGQFYACWAAHAIMTYVQPAWMPAAEAQAHARGETVAVRSERPIPTTRQESTVNETEARALRDENAQLKARIADLEHQLPERIAQRVEAAKAMPRRAQDSEPTSGSLDEDGLYRRIVERLLREGPPHLRVSTERPELTVEVERKIVTVDGSSVKGRVAKLIAIGFFKSAQGQGETRTELRRTGADVNTGTLSKVFAEFLSDGFLQKHGMTKYVEVPEMKVNIVEK